MGCRQVNQRFEVRPQIEPPGYHELADRTTTSDAVISRMTKHSGAIKALQFNPKHSNLLATGGAKGEVIVSTNLLPMFW
jgi:UV DNA damage repair endonuclease